MRQLEIDELTQFEFDMLTEIMLKEEQFEERNINKSYGKK